MHKTFFLSLSLLIAATSYAQQCNCPPGNGDDAQTLQTYHLGGKDLGICGFSTVEGEDVSYTRFSLFLCGDDKPIETWGEGMTCKVEQVKDALLVKEMYNLPVGQSFSTLWRPFYIHKFTISNGRVMESEYYNKELSKYNKEQIADVIKQYNDLPPTANEETMKVANMLVWASVSGSKETEAMLNSIPAKFGPFDNVLSQEWKAIQTVYNRWKTKR